MISDIGGIHSDNDICPSGLILPMTPSKCSLSDCETVSHSASNHAAPLSVFSFDRKMPSSGSRLGSQQAVCRHMSTASEDTGTRSSQLLNFCKTETGQSEAWASTLDDASANLPAWILQHNSVSSSIYHNEGVSMHDIGELRADLNALRATMTTKISEVSEMVDRLAIAAEAL